MSKVRVYEVAKQLNLDPKAVVALFQAIGVGDVRNHMSSVEPEHIERIKRHLEKQKTHDVVEERIRPTVVKRRAVAKPAAGDTPSATAMPGAPTSSPVLDASDSAKRSAPSVSSLADANGHPSVADVSATRDRESARMRVAAEATEERKSSRQLPAASPSVTSLAAERRSARSIVQEAMDAVDSGDEPMVPAAAPSVKALEVPAKVSEVTLGKNLEAHEVAQGKAAEAGVAADSFSAGELAETRVETVKMAPEAPASEMAAPSAVAAAPVAATEAAHPTPAAAVEAPAVPEGVPTPPPPAAPVRPSSAPKTGVEYWAGRPGVPMPQPSSLPRIGPGAGSTGTMPRRVQYDPRAAAPAGAPRRDARSPMGGGPMGRGGPQGRPGSGPMRGGPMGRGPAQPMRRPGGGGMSSTQEMGAHKKVIRIEENITLQAMAQRMSLKSTELLMKLLSMGMTGIHINTTLDADTAKILASDFGWEVEDVAQSEEQSIAEARGEDVGTDKAKTADEGTEGRSPVVTVMGHVDHGKTSLLDRIRRSNVASGEAGGITQHIGAYKVNTSHGMVVFLDTPGHEAFTQMRARGASVTDLVILVVAADDGVMPQTKEAVSHAKAAKVPIIVAVNKIDKPSADAERVKRELVDLGLTPEEWGGDTIFINVSALTGEGIDNLLEMVGLQSEVLELRANPKKAASGTVLEALLDRGRGPVARVLVQDGTLRVGDFVLAGPGFGKVRAMTNEHGKQVHEAGPSTPVEILGLSEVPGAGDPLHAVKDAKKAQEIAESRRGKMARSLIPSTAKVSLEELSKRMADSGQQELRIIIKGDVQGSVEALADALAKLSCEKVRLSIIHAGVGAITEGDINLAIAAKAIVIGFNTRPAGKAGSLAEENKIEIRTYSIIYNAVDDVKGAMEGLLPPTLVEKKLGKAEVRQVFRLKAGVIAGCYVTNGVIKRSGKVRLVREGNVLFDGKISALKRFKDDVKDVAEGFECGISLDGWTDIKEKDVLDVFEIEEIKQKL